MGVALRSGTSTMRWVIDLGLLEKVVFGLAPWRAGLTDVAENLVDDCGVGDICNDAQGSTAERA